MENLTPFNNNKEFDKFLEEWPTIFECNKDGMKLTQKFEDFYSQQEKEAISKYKKSARAEELTLGQVMAKVDIEIILEYVGKSLDKNTLFHLSHVVRGLKNTKLSNQELSLLKELVE